MRKLIKIQYLSPYQNRSMKVKTLGSVLFLSFSAVLSAQQLSLKDCISRAAENNTAIRIARQSLETRQKLENATQDNALPKVDLLAGYNYLGEPIKVNLQQVKDGIVEGTASQSVSSANTIYSAITGNQLPQTIQDIIYKTSRDIINAVYPNYNPEVARQSYFLAGITVRQPIYLGGKLKASRELARQQTESGNANLDAAKDLTTYNIALQYIQVMYLNSMLAKQQEILQSLDKNESYAQSLLKAEIIPPYQKNWADVARAQGEASLKSLQLEKENAMLTLKDLIGMPLNDPLEISEILPEENPLPIFSKETANADLRLLESKKAEAETGLNITRSLSMPNIFAIGNVQFFRKDLPLITPPWLIGVEMQWTLFDSERKSKRLASESLVKEADLLIQQKQQAVNLASKIAENKLVAIREQSETLDKARKQTYTTTEMVRKRLENSLSSVKDVNDALQLQYESEKLFYTSVVAYQAALATYFYINGNPEDITGYIR